MPTNDYDSRRANLEKRIRKAEMGEENRELLWSFKRDLEVQDYSRGRIYKLLNYLKIIAEHIDFDFEDATEENIKDTVAWLNRRDVADATKKYTKTILKSSFPWLPVIGGRYFPTGNCPNSGTKVTHGSFASRSSAKISCGSSSPRS